VMQSPGSGLFLREASLLDEPISTAPTSESGLEDDTNEGLARDARLFVKMRDLDRAESTFVDLSPAKRKKLVDLLVMESLCASRGVLARSTAQLFRRLETKTICNTGTFRKGFERGFSLVCEDADKPGSQMAMFLAVMLWGCSMSVDAIQHLAPLAKHGKVRDLIISNMELVEQQDNLFEVWREPGEEAVSPVSSSTSSAASEYSDQQERNDEEQDDAGQDDVGSYYIDDRSRANSLSGSDEELDYDYCDIGCGYCGHCAEHI